VSKEDVKVPGKQRLAHEGSSQVSFSAVSRSLHCMNWLYL
jgi:hypothetical protein